MLAFTDLKERQCDKVKREGEGIVNQSGEIERYLTTRRVLLAMAGLFLLNLLLRVFYLRYDFVNGDEGVRALSAMRMLEGARLYADVVTDKPPGASFFYAAVFAIFGRSMKAVHLAATVWNFATSLVVYVTASRFYGRRTALWAALFFVYFSTNYFTQDTMAANTELLMALPYTAAFYFFMLARTNLTDGTRARIGALVAAGFLTGIAAMFKQVGVLNLGVFALLEAGAMLRARKNEGGGQRLIVLALARLSFVGAGFCAVLALFALWLLKIDALADFWRNGILLNLFYIDAGPAYLWLKFLLTRGASYVFFNATIWSLSIWAVVHAFQTERRRRQNRNGDEGDGRETPEATRFDLEVGLWTAVTLVGVGMGDRFFGHYFIAALPALSLLGARGGRLLWERLRVSPGGVRWKTAAAALAVLFTIGLLRSHHRTSVLAYESMTGSRTRWSADWGMSRRQEEAEIVSAFVRTKIAEGEPLYIWGYAHDVYWQTGCRPASRYLTPYYIDGRFVDAEATVAESGERFRREAAADLIEDLRNARPRLILDVYSSIQSLPHPELVKFIATDYRDAGVVGPDPERPFRVFELRDPPRSGAAWQAARTRPFRANRTVNQQ
ncbi:MAG TPA: glycosyltransferase family 39 protein [Blastocatellia bacterium]|nr:glycosyltransferase family 39 protein [Blastocatellia bacterium]